MRKLADYNTFLKYQIDQKNQLSFYIINFEYKLILLKYYMSAKAHIHTLDSKEILIKSLKSGLSGASAMSIQVLSLMWLRTTMNYQFKNGGKFIPTLKLLYKQGGIYRFYRGIAPALIIGPMSRFGDTSANLFALTLFNNFEYTQKAPIFIQTSIASICAGLWRISTLPIDAWKTSKQVYGSEGLKILLGKFKLNGISAFYQGGVASALATMAGHYPWFVTYNYLDYYLPKHSFKEQKLTALLRSAFMGFCSTMISDTCSNSIRVLKTIKQTSSQKITYKQAFQEVFSKDGIQGLLFRGLKTKLLTNGIQGVIFSVFWRYIQQRIA